MLQSEQTYLIHVTGLVQGVGFRPFVWRLAREMGLRGCVYNAPAGVKIRLNADTASLAAFMQCLEDDAPALARVDSVQAQAIASASYDSFDIIASQQGEASTGCPPDAATCANCLAELIDPANRRFGYPFINCTDCGPRLSIIRRIPYDREYTTMANFDQCAACLVEYHDPANRRFHAQPNACAACGPQVWLEDRSGSRVAARDVFAYLSAAVLEGMIIAVKGLGGFHLACDATNAEAVEKLRTRKQRPDKPFALMVKNSDILQQYAVVDTAGEAAIRSRAAPVVLFDLVSVSTPPIAQNVAPGQYQLGFMLPYTPIHHLLLQGIDRPLIMTSGNRSGSPQVISNQAAHAQLGDMADLFLMHDRPIENRVDDSVIRQVAGTTHFLRRARGYAPTSLPLPRGFEDAPDLVALGGELKSTLCLLQSGRAIITQHLGDLEDYSTYQQYQNTLQLYANLYQFNTDLYVCDLHPEYLSSKFGVQLSEQGKQLSRVQHHHAHLAACLGDNGYPRAAEPVLGICMDGTGFGLDESLWGGEFLLGSYRQCERLAHIKAFPLVGGSKAIIEPWRCLYAQLKQAFPGEDIQGYQTCFPPLASPSCATFAHMIAKDLNCPMTTSAGRLFDAVAAALGCHAEQISYEGQAAIELETLAQSGDPAVKPYPFVIIGHEIDPARCWQALINDLNLQRVSKADMALAFHKGFAKVLVEMVCQLHRQHSFTTVALSGGVMQNTILLQLLQTDLAAANFRVLCHQQLPANDAGLSFGQALIAASQQLA
ncbi:carbamoyltransferase HypF [Pontibacter sp. JAM-7]|uniref:carbamoyltransferase HypF n=1 Tax=Pontibacter sp. JAM-7 TaxID=3366581 RepID=UPI003AF8D1D4